MYPSLSLLNSIDLDLRTLYSIEKSKFTCQANVAPERSCNKRLQHFLQSFQEGTWKALTMKGIRILLLEENMFQIKDPLCDY